jgi:hypothetical protein
MAVAPSSRWLEGHVCLTVMDLSVTRGPTSCGSKTSTLRVIA